MSDVTLTPAGKSALDVMKGDLLLPYQGNWTAHVWLADADEIPSGQVTLSWLGTSFSGYVLRAGSTEDRISCLIVGGQGGLWKPLPSKMYDYQLAVKLPLSEVLADAGETLSTQSSPSALLQTLPNWIRRKGDAGDQLNALADAVSVLWRMLPDGTVFLGLDAWQPAPSFDFALLSQNPAYATATLSVEQVGVFPGNKFQADPTVSPQNVGCCYYQIGPTLSRLTIWFLEEKATEDALHAGLASVIRETMRNTDYFATYPAEVVLQRADGTLDVIPDYPGLPPMTSIPIRVPVPGSKLHVKPGSRVRILFEEGDPRKYAADLFDSGSGGKAVARVGDTVALDDQLQAWIKQVTSAVNGLAAGAVTASPTQAGTINSGSPDWELP